MKNILVPTDLSPQSDNAIEYAAMLCKDFGAKLILLHVYMLPVPVSEIPYAMVSVEEMQKTSEGVIKKQADRISNTLGIEVEFMVRLGMVSDEVSDLEKEKNVDLVVMNLEETEELDTLLGSTTMAVIRKCRSAVLVIPGEAKFIHIMSVAYATDYSYIMSLKNLEPLKQLVTRYEAVLKVINVVKEGKAISAEQLSGKGKIQQALDGLNPDFVTVEATDLEHGLQRYINDKSPGILAMVAHKHNILERLFGTNHTKAMIHRTHIPLLVLQEKA